MIQEDESREKLQTLEYFYNFDKGCFEQTEVLTLEGTGPFEISLIFDFFFFICLNSFSTNLLLEALETIKRDVYEDKIYEITVLVQGYVLNPQITESFLIPMLKLLLRLPKIKYISLTFNNKVPQSFLGLILKNILEENTAKTLKTAILVLTLQDQENELPIDFVRRPFEINDSGTNLENLTILAKQDPLCPKSITHISDFLARATVLRGLKLSFPAYKVPKYSKADFEKPFKILAQEGLSNKKYLISLDLDIFSKSFEAFIDDSYIETLAPIFRTLPRLERLSINLRRMNNISVNSAAFFMAELFNCLLLNNLQIILADAMEVTSENLAQLAKELSQIRNLKTILLKCKFSLGVFNPFIQILYRALPHLESLNLADCSAKSDIGEDYACLGAIEPFVDFLDQIEQISGLMILLGNNFYDINVVSFGNRKLALKVWAAEPSDFEQLMQNGHKFFALLFDNLRRSSYNLFNVSLQLSHFTIPFFSISIFAQFLSQCHQLKSLKLKINFDHTTLGNDLLNAVATLPELLDIQLDFEKVPVPFTIIFKKNLYCKAKVCTNINYNGETGTDFVALFEARKRAMLVTFCIKRTLFSKKVKIRREILLELLGLFKLL